jgi:predicted small secreted protein
MRTTIASVVLCVVMLAGCATTQPAGHEALDATALDVAARTGAHAEDE